MHVNACNEYIADPWEIMQEFERIDNFKILQASFRKLSIEKVTWY